MYIHLYLMEKDMLDPHIKFQPLKRFKYMPQFPINQKLTTIEIRHHRCWIRSGSVVISCTTLSDSIRTIFGVSVSTNCQGMAFFVCFNTRFAITG